MVDPLFWSSLVNVSDCLPYFNADIPFFKIWRACKATHITTTGPSKQRALTP
jgi:hypothetical protein